jgi:hypothetical protein
MRSRVANFRSTFLPVLLLLLAPLPVAAQPADSASKPAPAARVLRDGQHDFDFLFGTRKFHLKRLLRPLTGSNEWVEYDGTSVCRPFWGGRGNMDEVELEGPAGRIEGITVRLYNPDSHQWSLYWASSKSGTMPPPPTVGSFDDHGRGEFYDHEPINGRMVFVRYVWSNITPTSAHFEQAFSEDGGKTWEVNWITDQEPVK